MAETWIVYAFIALVGYFLVNFLFKFVAGDNPFLISMILYGAASACMFLILAPKMEFSISATSTIIAVLIGICSVGATVFALKSMSIAPNPGYTVTIYSANFLLLAIVSVVVFKSELTTQKLAGIAATLIGLLLLSL